MKEVIFNGPSLKEQGFTADEIETIARTLSHRVTNFTREAAEHYTKELLAQGFTVDDSMAVLTL